MIGKLTGIVDSATSNQLILDVGGVGYLVGCSAHTLRNIGGKGATCVLFIETWVREEAINLYGFIEEAERDAFRLLTTVQGVGAKAALSILGVLSPARLTETIAAQDKASLTAADGVGPKLAARILTELKDKVAHLPLGPSMSAPNGKGSSNGGILSDALSALVNLGYRRMEAYAALQEALTQTGSEAKLDTLLRTALTSLSQKDKNQ